MLLLPLWLAAFQPAYAQPVSPQVLVLNSAAQVANLDEALVQLLDAEGRLNLDTVEGNPALAFEPVRQGQRQLIGDGSLWMRFDAMTVDHAVPWRLVVPLPGVDDVSLHYRDSAGQWVHQQAGDTLAVSRWTQAGRYPAFRLSHETARPVRYYLQVRHTRIPFSAMPQVMSDAKFIDRVQTENMVLGIYFGLAMLVVLLAAANGVASRDTGFGSYALYIALFAGAQAAFTGVASLYLWPDWTHTGRATMFLLPMAAAGAMGFVRTVAMPNRFSRPIDGLLLLLICVLPAAGLADVLLQTATSYTVMNTLIGISVVVVLGILGTGLVAGDRNTRWVLAGFLPVLVFTMFPLLRNLDLIGTGFFSDYGLMLGSAIEVPIIFYGLNRRVSNRRDLTARASGLADHDPLTGLHSTGIFLGHLRQSLVTAERYRLPFALLLVNLSNLAALQKNHGRDTGERALVMAAARIRAIAHSTDSVARVGDTQFALLIEGPIGMEDANDVATRILASGLRPSEQLPEAEPLLFHIAVGHLGSDASVAATEAEACLARMVQAVKDMNDGSRKAIRLIRL